jgi:hypothetical protein
MQLLERYARPQLICGSTGLLNSPCGNVWGGMMQHGAGAANEVGLGGGEDDECVRKLMKKMSKNLCIVFIEPCLLIC